MFAIDSQEFRKLTLLLARAFDSQVTESTTEGRCAVFDFGAGNSLLISADGPLVSQITEANVSKSYFSLVLDLDHALPRRT